MNSSLKTGLGFGLSSGIITTLGLMIGLNASTGSKVAVIGGILTIAIADAFSDALGIHISEESKNHHSEKEIWASTFFTFIFKAFFALSFLVPVLTLPLAAAVNASIVWGLSLIAIASYFIGRSGKSTALKVVAEHLAIAALVIVASNLVGGWIRTTFK